ncbi:putative hydro-lyase [Rhizobium sp. CNPSo 3490]|uniref:putative hydro-lyase n=1 Tax=Rhizobium sp. CNPSo 3490 TaxID=3021407 RepID=UPI00254AED25|nr:putative hydro-lyase [Rhizobium sp. CNPSo 3490]MDK4737121.1 putative hydro-lyase [Rhizobium sp. CNPSo 3490]
MLLSSNSAADHPPDAVRAAARSGAMSGQTSGMARGFAQGNLVILPREWAKDFLNFCLANPKPCPLLAVGRPGDPSLPGAGREIDIRTDVPSYRIFRDGNLVGEVENIADLWQDDFVSFLIGCSFSFEWALLSAGLNVRHIELGTNVPMYKTNIECVSAGRFSGQYVASMRPMKPADAIRAIEITSRMPQVHGAPVHFGDPSAIGIPDITRPDYGDPVPVREGEIPVFWACGVTPQVALANAKPPIAITHSPGCMLLTDIPDDDLITGKFRFSAPDW